MAPPEHLVSDEIAQQRDLVAAHDTIARHRRELAALINDGKDRRLVRASGELGAAVESMDKATQAILGHVERIDDNAKSLAATLKSDYARSLAHDIQENVVRVYEACNFQDLAGQRIGKVMAMLETVEQQIAAMLARCSGAADACATGQRAAGLINGPKLDGDSGHASQRDVDAMFNPAI